MLALGLLLPVIFLSLYTPTYHYAYSSFPSDKYYMMIVLFFFLGLCWFLSFSFLSSPCFHFFSLFLLAVMAHIHINSSAHPRFAHRRFIDIPSFNCAIRFLRILLLLLVVVVLGLLISSSFFFFTLYVFTIHLGDPRPSSISLLAYTLLFFLFFYSVLFFWLGLNRNMAYYNLHIHTHSRADRVALVHVRKFEDARLGLCSEEFGCMLW